MDTAASSRELGIGIREEQLTELVTGYIESNRPPPAPANRYERLGGIAIEMPFDRRYSRDGSIEYGKDYDTVRTPIGRFELISAHSRRNNTVELLIDEFHERGGLAARTTFSWVDNNVMKRRQSVFNEPMCDPIDYSRQASDDEFGILEQLFASSSDMDDTLLELLVELDAQDAYEMRRRHREYYESKQKLREDLEAINEAQRNAWRHAHDYVIG